MLMGMEIRDLSVRECLHTAGEFLKSGGLNVIYYLNGQALLVSEDFEEIRHLVEEATLSFRIRRIFYGRQDLTTEPGKRKLKEIFFSKVFLRYAAGKKRASSCWLTVLRGPQP